MSQGALITIELITSNYKTAYKEIITRESAQGALSPIGLIPSIFNWPQGNNTKRVVPRGTKSHWINPYQFIYCLQGNNIKRVGPRGTKAHWFNP